MENINPAKKLKIEDIIEYLESKEKVLRNFEWEAKEAKDYPACMYLYGGIILIEQLIQEMSDKYCR